MADTRFHIHTANRIPITEHTGISTVGSTSGATGIPMVATLLSMAGAGRNKQPDVYKLWVMVSSEGLARFAIASPPTETYRPDTADVSRYFCTKVLVK